MGICRIVTISILFCIGCSLRARISRNLHRFSIDLAQYFFFFILANNISNRFRQKWSWKFKSDFVVADVSPYTVIWTSDCIDNVFLVTIICFPAEQIVFIGNFIFCHVSMDQIVMWMLAQFLIGMIQKLVYNIVIVRICTGYNFWTRNRSIVNKLLLDFSQRNIIGLVSFLGKHHCGK